MDKKSNYKFCRRDALKGLAGLPFLGYFANRFYISQQRSTQQLNVDWSAYGISEYGPNIIPAKGYNTKGNRIRGGVDALFRSGGSSKANPSKIYPTYKDMLLDDKLDAAINLMPDHFYAKVATDAASAGNQITHDYDGVNQRMGKCRSSDRHSFIYTLLVR